MLGKRSVTLLLAMGSMLLVGRAVAPLAYRSLVLDRKLAAAVKDFDLPEAERLIASGADVNLRMEENRSFSGLPETALELAVFADDPDCVRRLVRRGANVDATRTTGVTPLMLAATGDHLAVLGALLDAGANVNARDANEETALMYAVAHGMVTYVGTGSHPQTRTYRDPKVIRLLLRAGAKPNLVNPTGQTAMLMAEERGERRFVSAFREVRAKGLHEALADTPGADLFYAVRTDDLGAVKRLIRNGARMAVQDRSGKTPLMYALMDGRREPGKLLVRYLLRHAPDVKQALKLRDGDGATVLSQAASSSDIDFKLLLDAGADPNADPELFYLASPAQKRLLLQAGVRPPRLPRW